MHCGILKDSWNQSQAVLELARRAFSEGDLEQLQGLADGLDGEEPHADRVVELRDELATRRRFEEREAFRGRVEEALASGDPRRLVQLRGEVAGDVELLRLAGELAGADAERRAGFQGCLDALREADERVDEIGFARALVRARSLIEGDLELEERLAPWERRADEVVHDRLKPKEAAGLVALACVPFPLGLWLLATTTDQLHTRWKETHPRRAKALANVAMVAGPGIALLQIVALGYWLISR
jgi:hypothetical protein